MPSFFKRRKGLFKKAKELAVLCNAQVAAIVISQGNNFYLSAKPSFDEVINRWNTRNEPGAQEGIEEQLKSEEDIEEEIKEDMQLLLDVKVEYEQLTKEVDELKLRFSQMEGKELGNLSGEELMRLEETIQNSSRLVEAELREKQQEYYEKLRSDNEQTVEKIGGELQQTMGSHLTNEAGQQNVTNEQKTLPYPANQEDLDDLVRLRLGHGKWK